MALVLAALCVPLAYGGNVTIPDTVVSGGLGTWYNQTVSSTNPAGEVNEVEPNCVATKAWDLEGFATSGTTLYTIGTWNFMSGQPGDYKNDGTNWTSGDIFIAIAPASTPKYGLTAVGTGSGNGTITNTFGYNYVLHMNWTAGSPTFDIYKIDSDTLLSVYFNQNNGSNPYAYVSGGDPVDGAQGLSFTYQTLSYANVLALCGVYTTTADLHNVVGTDLSSIWNGTDEIWFHFTQECGNDNLMGYRPGGIPLPLPPSALLLGTGLLGLVGLGWRRRQTKV